MQKALIGILAVTTAVLGVLYGVQSKRLQEAQAQARRAEMARATIADEQETRTARLAELERTNQRLDEQVQKFAVVTTSLRTNEAQKSSALAALSQRMQSLQTSTNGDEKGGLFGKGMGEMLGKMMKDPAMREMMREQQKAMINMMYAGLFKDLNLSPEEKDKFKELLTDAQMKNVEAAQGLFGDKESAGEETTKQVADAKKQTDAAIKTLLGDNGYEKYQDYQKNMGERMQLDQLKNQFAAEKMPLRDEQSAQLMQIMKEEKTATPPPIPSDQTQVPTRETFTADNLEKQLTWMDDYNHRVLERASQVLTPDQLKQYRSFQEQQASMQKMGLQMARQMFGGEKAGTAPGGTRLK